MAGKTGFGTSWVPAQGDALVEQTRAAVNAIRAKYDEVKAVLQQLKGEDVIGESETKDKLLEVIANLDKTFDILLEKLNNVEQTLNEVFEAVNAAAGANMSATDEASSSVGNAAKKAEDTNGSGAN